MLQIENIHAPPPINQGRAINLPILGMSGPCEFPHVESNETAPPRLVVLFRQFL